MSVDEIERRIPHRPPMRLLDEIVTLESDRIVCRKTFQADEYFVQGHFEGNPIVPGVIQCECCLQAGAALLADHPSQSEQEPSTSDREAAADQVVPVATRMDSVKFKRIVRPGDTVDIEVTLNDQISNAYFMTGKLLLGGKVAARLDFACSVTAVPPSTESST